MLQSSVQRPSRKSPKASSASLSSRPLATSCSNWRSQTLASNSANTREKLPTLLALIERRPPESPIECSCAEHRSDLRLWRNAEPGTKALELRTSWLTFQVREVGWSFSPERGNFAITAGSYNSIQFALLLQSERSRQRQQARSRIENVSSLADNSGKLLRHWLETPEQNICLMRDGENHKESHSRSIPDYY